MKILHVVTLISPDGAYGGPARVALNQARALRDQGHDVTIAGGTRGYTSIPTHVDSVPVHLFPVRSVVPRSGFAGMVSPGLLRWFGRHGQEYDVVHVHLARDLVTMPIARWALRRGRRTVVQTHGMIDPSTNPLARPLDAALTRPILAGAETVFCLTTREKDDLEQVGRGNFTILTNGVPVPDTVVPAPEGRPNVLFLARLHARKRPLTFVRAAARLLDSGSPARFTLVGPDEGEGPAVRQAIAEAGHTDRISWSGALSPDRTWEAVSASTVYVLPAVNEPLGMSVLEAMSAARPVVVTDSCGLASVVRDHRCGAVTDDSVDSLVGALTQLLADPDAAAAMGLRGRRAVEDQFGMDSIARRLVSAYRGERAAQPDR